MNGLLFKLTKEPVSGIFSLDLGKSTCLAYEDNEAG